MVPALEILDQIVRFIIGGIFIYSGSKKLNNVGLTWKTIMDYKILPNFAAVIFAAALAPVEFGFGLLLASNTLPNVVAMILLLLTFVFTLAICSSLIRGLDHECGCSGSGAKIHLGLVFRNIIIMGGLTFVAALPRATNSLHFMGFILILLFIVFGFCIQYYTLKGKSL